ncbi:MAG: polysaccharide export protein [Cytophagales bacterium]|nr:polysaccharide export protein [Cytophagales bacterium]
MQKLLVYISVFFLVSACKTQSVFQDSRSERKHLKANLDSAFYYDPGYEYRIRNGDKISLSVWGQEALSVGSVYGIYNSNKVYGKWLLVDAAGKIEIPKIGPMEVAGFTVVDLKDTLRAMFGKWIVNPIVDVKVLNKEITVIGEVRDPSVLTVDKDNNPLLEIIARSGGFDTFANLKYVKVLRQERDHVKMANIDLSVSGNYFQQNIQLHPGDIVVVPPRRYKEFDRRVSIIIPFTTAITAAAILVAAF